MPDSETKASLHLHLLREVAAGLGLSLSPRQMQQLAIHFALLLQWNEKMSLTSLRRPEQVATRHFEESLFLAAVLPLERLPAQGLLVDVGSGAGFPGLPLKVAWPQLPAILLEPNRKKAAFLKEVIRQSGLRNVTVRTERLAEAQRPDQETGQCLAGRAALATMRAVGLTNDLLADLLQLLAPSGRVALFLGEKDAERLSATAAFAWGQPLAIPHSERRVLLIGRATAAPTATP